MRSPRAYYLTVRHTCRTRKFAEEIGLDVLQRLSDGHETVWVWVEGPRNDGMFKDTQVVVESYEPEAAR